MESTLLNKIISRYKAILFKKFIRFLKEKGLYSEYFRIMRTNPRGEYQRNYNGNLAYFFNESLPGNWTTSCFVWHEYNSDDVNWADIHKEWNIYMYTNEI